MKNFDHKQIAKNIAVRTLTTAVELGIEIPVQYFAAAVTEREEDAMACATPERTHSALDNMMYYLIFSKWAVDGLKKALFWSQEITHALEKEVRS